MHRVSVLTKTPKPVKVHNPIGFIQREHPILGLIWSTPFYPTPDAFTFGQRMAFFILLLLLNFVVYAGTAIVLAFISPASHAPDFCSHAKYAQESCQTDATTFPSIYDAQSTAWPEELTCSFNNKDTTVKPFGLNDRFKYPVVVDSVDFQTVWNHSLTLLQMAEYPNGTYSGYVPYLDAPCIPYCKTFSEAIFTIDAGQYEKNTEADDWPSKDLRVACADNELSGGYVPLICVDVQRMYETDCKTLAEWQLTLRSIVFYGDGNVSFYFVKIAITVFFVLPFTTFLKKSMKIINAPKAPLIARAIAYPVFLGLATAGILLAYLLIGTSTSVGEVWENDATAFFSALGIGQLAEIPKLFILYYCCFRRGLEKKYNTLLEEWEESQGGGQHRDRGGSLDPTSEDALMANANANDLAAMYAMGLMTGPSPTMGLVFDVNGQPIDPASGGGGMAWGGAAVDAGVQGGEVSPSSQSAFSPGVTHPFGAPEEIAASRRGSLMSDGGGSPTRGTIRGEPALGHVAGTPGMIIGGMAGGGAGMVGGMAPVPLPESSSSMTSSLSSDSE